MSRFLRGLGLRSPRSILSSLAEVQQSTVLFWACWAAYFSTYLGRLNFSASLSEIIVSEGFAKSAAGLIGTLFFLSYGAGQLLSGFLGDKLSPRMFVFTGLVGSGACNLLMAVSHTATLMAGVWCVNGLFQSFVWSPMLRLLVEHTEPEKRMKACLYMNYTVPAGTLAAYGLAALLLRFSSWRATFLLGAGVVLCAAAFWWFIVGPIEKQPPMSALTPAGTAAGGGSASLGKILLESGMLVFMLVLLVQGALKDGITTWVPTYIGETFGLSSVLSVAGTMILPLFNLLGVYAASFVNERMLRNEVTTAGAFFLLCAVSLLVLRIFSGAHALLSFLLLGLATTAMMAVNTMMVAVLPTYFSGVGRTSTVSGLLNSAVYTGCAISTYGFGAAAAAFGWSRTISLWCVCSLLGAAGCIAGFGLWKRYRQNNFQIKQRS